jgi:hypothetical protein
MNDQKTGNHQTPCADCPTLLISGLDSLYVSYYLDTTRGELDWDGLAYEKERVQQTHDRGFSEIRLGTEYFALMPYGKKPYRYILSNRFFEVRLAERLMPSCHVQFFSESLWQEGLNALSGRFRDWCASMALFDVKPEVVARADWAFDYHLPDMDAEPDWFVTRARKDAVFRENQAVQTFQFGRGDIVIRVYDKVAEIEQESEKAWFFDLWGRDDDVWRIEFQVRGTRLKEGGIYSLDDLRAFQGDILRELASGHTTLRRPSRDGNRSRWPLHPLWAVLLEAIAALPQTGLVREIEYQAAKAMYGYAKRLGMVGSLRDGTDDIPKLDRVLATLPTLFRKFHSDEEWRDAVAYRIKKYRLGQ